MKIVVAMDSFKGCLSSREAGEGRLDAQTAMDKAPAEVAALAHAYGLPAIALVAAFVIFGLRLFFYIIFIGC